MTISFQKSFSYTIANGQTNGPTCTRQQYEDMTSLIIAAPAVMVETTKIQINSLPDGSGIWSDLQNETPADIAGPIAGKARYYTQLVGAPAWRLVANVGVTGAKTHVCSGQWTT